MRVLCREADTGLLLNKPSINGDSPGTLMRFVLGAAVVR
jgi:hypothetical protein